MGYVCSAVLLANRTTINAYHLLPSVTRALQLCPAFVHALVQRRALRPARRRWIMQELLDWLTRLSQTDFGGAPPPDGPPPK